MLVRMGLMPLAFRNSVTSPPNLASRPSTTHRSTGQWKRLWQLLYDPRPSRMRHGVEVQNAAAVFDHKQTIKYPKGQDGIQNR